MIRIKRWRPVPLRTAVFPLSLTAVITLVLSANSAIAQQGPPVGGSPAATVAAPAPIADPLASTEPSSQIFACQESHCGHLIDLLIRNRLRQQTATFGAELAPGLILSAPPSFPPLGDLELLNVSLVADGTPSLGPVIQLVEAEMGPSIYSLCGEFPEMVPFKCGHPRSMASSAEARGQNHAINFKSARRVFAAA